MKVCQIIPAYYPSFYYGGPTHTVDALCRYLARMGCEVRVVATNSNGPRETVNVDTQRDVIREPNLSVRYCRRGWIEGFSWRLLPVMWRDIRWANVVHVTAVYSPSSVVALIIARLSGKPVVWSPRGSLQRWRGNSGSLIKHVWEQMCLFLAPRQTVLHVTSEDEAVQSRARMPGMEAVVIPNGVEIPETVVERTPSEALRILYLGRLHPIKGIENLLDACSLLPNSLARPFSLTIAGTGEDEYTKVLTRRSEAIGDMIRLIGEVTGEAKERVFAKADVVVVPSFTENFGMTVAEALARGIPVIASQGTPWQRLEEIGAGLWVPNAPESLERAIVSIATLDLPAMGRAGRAWMQREYAWPAVAQKMAALYDRFSDRAAFRLAESAQ